MIRRIFAVCVLATLAAVPATAGVISYDAEGDWQIAMGTWSTFGFEGFSGNVTTQFPGVTFAPYDGGTPKTATAYAHSGTQSMISALTATHGGIGWQATFDQDLQGVAFWSHGVQVAGSTITLLDSTGVTLGALDLMAVGGGHGPFDHGFNGFISDAVDIRSIRVDVHNSDAVRHDDFQFGTRGGSGGVVPLPGAVWMGLGLLGVLVAVRRRRR